MSKRMQENSPLLILLFNYYCLAALKNYPTVFLKDINNKSGFGSQVLACMLISSM